MTILKAMLMVGTLVLTGCVSYTDSQGRECRATVTDPLRAVVFGGPAASCKEAANVQ